VVVDPHQSVEFCWSKSHQRWELSISSIVGK
jgi:hypothetical protein